MPTELLDLVADPGPARAQRATTAMLGMKKIDVEALRRAADGGWASGIRAATVGVRR